VLSANPSGTAVGTINYNFWYKCTYANADIAGATAACGTLTVPAAGACVNTPGVGYKCNGVSDDPKAIPAFSYSPASTYTAKVIVERGTAPNAQATATVTVSPAPSCTSATPDGTLVPASQTTHDIFVNGVANASAADVFVWSQANGQDDMVRYSAVNQGGGIWRATVNLNNHQSGNPNYGQFSAHVYLDWPTKGLTHYCNNADFTWSPPAPNPDVDVTIEAVNGSESFSLSGIKDGDVLTFRTIFRNQTGADPATAFEGDIDLSSNLTSPSNFTCVACAGGSLTNSIFDTFRWEGSLTGGSQVEMEFSATVDTQTNQVKEIMTVDAAGNFEPGPIPFNARLILLASPGDPDKPIFREIPP
jgi:hypothetical protein